MGETACLITIMFRMRRTELECRRGVLLLRPLCCRSLCRTYDSCHAARGCGIRADFCHERQCLCGRYCEQQDRRNERTPDEAAGREKASGGDPEISQKSKKIEKERFLCFLFPEAGSFQHALVIRALIQSTISCLSKNNRYHFVIGVVVEGGDGSLHGFAA